MDPLRRCGVQGIRPKSLAIPVTILRADLLGHKSLSEFVALKIKKTRGSGQHEIKIYTRFAPGPTPHPGSSNTLAIERSLQHPRPQWYPFVPCL
jgi:hypothetical protein